MKIWRIEHGCDSHHGPVWSPGSCPTGFRTAPPYGICNETPATDNLLGYMDEDEICGTTEQQFPLWWSNAYRYDLDSNMYVEEYPQELPPGWFAVQYAIPDDRVRVGRHQVLFHRKDATRVYRTRKNFPRQTPGCPCPAHNWWS